MTDTRFKIKILLSYDGTDFGGWQRQTQPGKPTVQATIEQALSQIFAEPIKICGAGRTDAGVHALGQVAHAWVPKDPRRYNLLKALNALTPPTIAFQNVWLAPADFHAIASASSKDYVYWILQRPTPSAIRARFCTWIARPLDVEKLNAYSRFLTGMQDFKSFQSAGTDVSHTVREVLTARWQRRPGDLLEFSISGTGFLKQMVRNIVGTQLQLLSRQAPEEAMKDILDARDRRQAGPSAPPHGLFLARVVYPEVLDNKCRKI